MADDEVLSFLDEEVDGNKTVEEMVSESNAAEMVEPKEAEAVEPEKVEPETVETSTGEKDATPPVAEPEAPKQAPIAALTDERAKRQDAERRLHDVEAQMRLMNMQRQEPPKTPDIFEDPQGAMSHAVAPLQAQLQKQKLESSRFYAEQQFGADVVKEAYAYFDQHPQESAALLQHPSPFHAAVEHYKRQTIVQQMGNDPDAYINGLVETKLQERMATAPVTSAPKAPPPSMAKTSGSGDKVDMTGTAFDSMFPS